MAKAIHHMPKDSALGIQFCIVNSVENPSTTQQAVNLLKKLKRNNREKLIEILDEYYDGWPLLHFAAEHGNAIICRMLLEYDAKTNLKDQAGDTALHRASRREHLECIDILCSFGADVLAQNNEGKTPMQLAEDHGKTTAVGRLVAMAEKTHVIGPMVKESLREITVNKGKIEENRCCAEKNANSITDLHSKQMQLIAELEQLKAQMARQQEEDQQDQHGGEVEPHEQLDVRNNHPVIPQDRLQAQHQDDDAAAAVVQQEVDKLTSQMARLQDDVAALREALVKTQRKQEELEQSQQERGDQVDRLNRAVFHVPTSEDPKLFRQLRRNYRLVLTELNGWEMRGALFEEGVLSIQEIGYIRGSGDEEQQLESLLIQLFSKDPSCWVKPFMDALKKMDMNLFNAITSTEDETTLKEPV